MPYVPLQQAMQSYLGKSGKTSTGSSQHGYTPLAQKMKTYLTSNTGQAPFKPKKITTPKPVQKPNLMSTVANDIGAGVQNAGKFINNLPLVKQFNNPLVLPTANFADNMPDKTPLDKATKFGAGLAEGLVNIAPNAINAGTSIAQHAVQKNSNPKQVAGDVADIVSLPLSFLSFGEAAVLKQAAKQGIIQIGKTVLKDGAINGGIFGFLGGVSGGRNTQNNTDYAKSVATNTAIGAATGVALGVAGSAASSLGGRVITRIVKGKPKLLGVEMTPQTAQSTVIHGNLQNTPIGNELLKVSVQAQKSGDNIHVTPIGLTNGKDAVKTPAGEKVVVSLVKPSTTPEGINTPPATPYDTPDIVQARESQAKIANTSEINTPERQQFREQTTNTLYENGGYSDPSKRPTTTVNQNRRADIVTGLPAAGKNTVLSDPLVKEHGSILIDSDESKYLLPESNGGSYNGAVHDESTDINANVLGKATENGDNIVIPTVGTNPERTVQLASTLKELGYDVHLHHNEVSVETSIQRAIDRFRHTGKFVDPSYIYHEVGLRPNENFDKIKTNPVFTSYEKYNNEVAKGQSPTLIEKGVNTEGKGSVQSENQSRRSSGEQNDRGTQKAGTTENGKTSKQQDASAQESTNTKSTSQQTDRTSGNGTVSQSGEPTSQKPVGTGPLKQSSAYKHMLEHLQQTDPKRYEEIKDGKVTYNVNKAKEDLAKAETLIEKDPERAYRVGMGYENAPEGQTANAIATTLSARALAENDTKVYTNLERALSLRSTRFGQENAALRGRFNDNSPHTYIQQLLDARLRQIGKGRITEGMDAIKNAVGSKISSAKANAINKIDQTAIRLAKELKQKQVKIRMAQDILDQLTCK